MKECEKGTRIGGEWSESSQPPTVAIIFLIFWAEWAPSFLADSVCDFFAFSARNLRLKTILFDRFSPQGASLRRITSSSAIYRRDLGILGQSSTGGTRWDKVEEPGGFYTDSTPTQDCLRLLTSRC